MGKKTELVKKVARSHEFWARVDAVSTGVALTVEGVVLALYGLPALPLLLGAAGAVGVAALLGCGAYSLHLGITSTTRFLKTAWAGVYNKPPPQIPPPKPTLLQRLARHPLFAPAVKKLKTRPLVQRLLNSRLGRTRAGLSQVQRDTFMTSLNMKGSLFVGGSAAVFIVRHLLALPMLTLGGAVTAATAAAAFYVAKSVFDITCNARLLIGVLRDRRAARQKAENPAAAPKALVPKTPAPAPSAIPVSPTPAPGLAPVFIKSAGPAETPPAPPAPQPPKPSLPPQPPPAGA